MNKVERSSLTRKAYTPKLAADFASLMEKQAKPVYENLGIVFPVITSSTVSLLGECQSASLVEIAKQLGIAHQLASQRIKVLLKLNVICPQQDPDDKRKTNYQLTEFGVAQHARLQTYLEQADKVFAKLNKELDVDVAMVLRRLNQEFDRQSLLHRMVGEHE